MFGFYKVAVASIYTELANVSSNLTEMLQIINSAKSKGVSILLFPELALSGYSLGDILYFSQLYNSQNMAIEEILSKSRGSKMVIVFGAMLKYQDRLYNTAFVVQNGKILGVVPKSYIPNKGEFYEKRQFVSGINIKGKNISFLKQKSTPFGVDLLFSDDEVTFGVEICEDLWAVTPPSLAMVASGANIILNPSASNELIGKADYRVSLVSSQSARGVCGYMYASSGVGESTTDTLFGGDCMVAEYGSIIARSKRFELKSHMTVADIDIFRLKSLRLNEGAFSDSVAVDFRVVDLEPLTPSREIQRAIEPHPFVPSTKSQRDKRAEEIISIQAHSLIKRLEHTGIKKAVIGVSGGLDSTLALLVTERAFEIMGRSSKDILAISMPGFGTTSRTYKNAIALNRILNVTEKTIPIGDLVLAEFELIGQNPKVHDITYENVQARVRTSILMNIANKDGGLVIGTGDLSEIALGWSTYNGDHMSMYAINSSIPKTLIKYLIEYFSQEDTLLTGVLKDILKTPISPELLPPEGAGDISQKTEDIIGPYELHDFFLYHFIRYSSPVERIFHLATLAFRGKYDSETIKKWLRVFIKRFFSQQFKRSCMPDGPKVGTISLSPRADWRMPSDASPREWLDALDRL